MVGGLPLMQVLAGIAFLSLFCLLSSVQAASSPGSRKNNPEVVYDQGIVVTLHGIHIQVTERVLQEVLEQIHQTSGVHFSFPQVLGNIPITATIVASDWPAAIRELLRPFNSFEVWGINGKDLLRVVILGYGRAEMLSPERVGSLKKDYPKREETKTPESPPTIPIPPLPGPPPTLIPCGKGCIKWR
jgi:hypothetical protein